MAALAGGPARAVYYTTAAGEDVLLSALKAKGFAVTMAYDYQKFQEALAGSGHPLVIAYNPANTFGDVSYRVASDLSAHLAAGGAAWLVDWCLIAGLAAPFQGGYAGGWDQQPLNISDGYLAAGVANPLPLNDSGIPDISPSYPAWSWGLAPSGDATALGGTFRLLGQSHPQARRAAVL